MFNSKLAFFCPAIVFISGLVSCAPDKTAKDVYIAPIPKITKGTQTIPLKEWDRSNVKELDLHDSIDVRGSGAETMEAVSRCRKGLHDIFASVRIPNPQQVSLFQILPFEIVVADLKRTSASCGVEISLRNEAGSKHVFNLSYATIKDERRPQAFLVRNSEAITSSRERIPANLINGIKLRDPHGQKGQAAVYCEDGKTKDLDFSGVADFSDFDFDRMEPYAGKSPQIFAQRPLQLCRAVILSGQNLQALTPVFELQLRRPPLVVHAIHLPNRTAKRQPEPRIEFIHGRKLQTGQYRITNPGQQIRWVKIAKTPRHVQISLVENVYLKGSVIRPYLRLSPLASAKNSIREERDMWVVQIPEGSFLDVIAEVTTPAPLNCVAGNNLRVMIDFPQLGEFEELSDSGLVLQPYSFELGPRFFLSNFHLEGISAPITQAIAATSLCNW